MTTTTRRTARLYRDPVDKKIGGVASGVARYFDIDTTLMRAIWAASILVGGFGIFLYLILWFILDEDPELLGLEDSHVEPAETPATAEAVDEISNPSGSERLEGEDPVDEQVDPEHDRHN